LLDAPQWSRPLLDWLIKPKEFAQ